MHTEHYVSTTKIAAITLWAAAVAMMLATWILAFLGESFHTVAILLAFTAGVVAPAAAVAHVKVYFLKTTTLIRITSGLTVPELDRDGDRGLRSVP